MLELIFQGFLEWAHGLALECWQYFSTALLDIMSMDFAYLKSHAPVVDEIMQILLAVGWALLIGNLVFQALKSMAVGLGFEGEDPKLLFARTFVFAFLLLASPQICEIGLSMTSKIIELLQIPDAVNVTFVDESVFGAIGAAWLLVIIFGIIVMFKVFKLLLEIAERYVILAMLTITAPLAFAMGGSKSTSEIFTGWCRMFGSMCLLMVTNVIFFKMLLSVLATVPSGLDVLPWIVLILTIVKVARKADAIVTRIGLNPAITGDSLGRGLPGTLTYMVVRSAASQITKAVGKSAGNGGKGAAPNAPSGGPRMGGPSGGHGNTAEYVRQSAAQQSSTNQSTSQQSSAAQSASVHTGAPQSPSQEKSAPSAAQDSMPKNSTAPRPSQERKSSVPLGTRRSPTHIKAATKIPPVGAQNASGRPGTAGKAGASARPSVAGAAETLQSGVRSPASQRMRVHSPETTQPGRAGTSAAPSASRMSQINAQKVQGGATGQVTQAAEHTGITVGQTTVNTLQDNSPRPAAGIGGAMLTTASVRGGIQTVQQHTPNARYTQRPPKQPTGQASPPRAESPHPGTAGMQSAVSAQRPSGEPRPGRNGIPSRTAVSPDARQHSPIRQESRSASAAAAPTLKGTAPNRHPDPAGTAAGVPSASQSRQTVRPSAPSAKSSAQPGKKAVSTTAALKGSVKADGDVKPSRKQRGRKHG